MKLLNILIGVIMGLVLSSAYLLVTYNVTISFMSYEEGSYEFFLPALIGLVITMAISMGAFFLLGKKRRLLRIAFLTATGIVSSIFFIILSPIMYYY